MPTARKTRPQPAPDPTETVEAVVGAWGHNLGVRLPAAFVRRLKLRPGERLRLTIRRAKRRPTLEELCASMKPGNEAPLVNWDKPMGEEIL